MVGRVPARSLQVHVFTALAEGCRGMDVPAAVLTGPNGLRIYSGSSLVMLPKPDFSMPFNVITYVMTVFALYTGGGIKAIMYRHQKKEKPVLDHMTNSFKERVKERLTKLFTRKAKGD